MRKGFLFLQKDMEKCTKCGINDKHHKNYCKECFNKQQRERRAKNNNASTKKYEKTKKGFLVRLYRNMESRIKGIQKEKFHLYEGKELLKREDFYRWALESNSCFHNLFDNWVESGYDRKLSPSVDRVNPSIGYIISNMEWVTHSENSRRGAQQKIEKYNLNKRG